MDLKGTVVRLAQESTGPTFAVEFEAVDETAREFLNRVIRAGVARRVVPPPLPPAKPSPTA
jgi:hypothetical protein